MSDERRQIDVETFGEYSDNRWPLVYFIEAVTADVPEEFRDSATVELYFGESGGHLTVQYTRPETDEEMRHRLAEDENYLRRLERRERNEYERLKAKFEGKS